MLPAADWTLVANGGRRLIGMDTSDSLAEGAALVMLTW